MNEQNKRRAATKPSPAHAGEAASAPRPHAPRARGRARARNEWQDLLTERLEEAAAQGAFDDLPGTGKPLQLDERPNEPADMRMANKLLKDNDLTPAWISDRNALLAETEALRGAMRRQWELVCARAKTPGTDGEALRSVWNRSLVLWETQISDLNRRIANLNITLPIWRMELHRLRLDEELNRVGAARALHADDP